MSTDDRQVRWVDRIFESIPILLTLGGMVLGAIVWFIRLESRVNDSYNHMQTWQASSDARTKERNTEMEEVRRRMTVIETIQHCHEIGGCK